MADDGTYISITSRADPAAKGQLAQIQLERKVITIEEIADKLQFALDNYRRALHRYQRGHDFTEDWERAIEALELERRNVTSYLAVSHHNIGVIYCKESQWEKAVAHFQQALTLAPRYALAAFNYAVALNRMGRAEESQAMLAKARELGYQPKEKPEAEGG